LKDIARKQNGKGEAFIVFNGVWKKCHCVVWYTIAREVHMGLALLFNKTFKALGGGIAIANMGGFWTSASGWGRIKFVDTTYVWSVQMTVLLCSCFSGLKLEGHPEFQLFKGWAALVVLWHSGPTMVTVIARILLS
jgi:hypothetical protein